MRDGAAMPVGVAKQEWKARGAGAKGNRAKGH